MFDNRDKRIQITFLRTCFAWMQTAEWQKGEMIKKWKVYLSKIYTCTDVYFVLCNQPETCLQKKKYSKFSQIFSAGQRV